MRQQARKSTYATRPRLRAPRCHAALPERTPARWYAEASVQPVEGLERERYIREADGRTLLHWCAGAAQQSNKRSGWLLGDLSYAAVRFRDALKNQELSACKLGRKPSKTPVLIRQDLVETEKLFGDHGR